MRKILLLLSVIFGLCFGGVPVAFASGYQNAFESVFENKADIPNFQAIAVKNLTKSETFVHDRHEFLGVRKLIDILGEVKDPSRKIHFKTTYMRVSDKDTISVQDEATWYYFLKKSAKKPVYALYYKNNKVTQAMTENDLLIVGKVNDSEIYVILLANGSKKKAAFLDGFGDAPAKKNTVEKPSFWSRLWGTSTTIEEEQTIEVPESAQLKDINAKDWVRIYFTPGPDCENNIIKLMDQAHNVDIAVYSITNPAIVDSILAAHKRGAKIRVITDRTQAKGKSSLVEKIRDAGIPVVTNVKHKIEHNKFAVFDGRHIVSGSYNWTTNASQFNSENCLFFDQPKKEYSERFKYLWKLYNQKDN